MLANEYLQSIISKYRVVTGEGSQAWKTGREIYPLIQKWAGAQLREAFFSGSNAKGTAVRGATDVDLFISLKSDTTNTLKEIFDSLHYLMQSNGYSGVHKQNVSIHVGHNGMDVDLVPAVHYGGNSEDHWLYVNKSNRERIKTNVNTHIAQIQASGRINEIILAKIWRKNHSLDFPSFYLELAVIEALKYKRSDLSTNFMSILEYFSDGFSSARFEDPANTNNIISDTLTVVEKKTIASQATKSKVESYLEQIVW